jgi:CBS domain-containing protein
MRLHEIMTRDVQIISASATIAEARAAMKSKRVHHLLVRDGRQIVGVVSQRDFGVRPGTAEKQRVADVMPLDLVTGTPNTTVQQAANLCRGRSVGCLPVLDGFKPVGIVTTTDLLARLARRTGRG